MLFMTNIPSIGNANEEIAVCGPECNRIVLSATWSSYPHNADVQLTDGGPSGTPELPDGIPGLPFAGAPAGFLSFGSLAVNSKMLSRANHGAAEANMPTKIIAQTPVAITMLRRVILIADTSCLTVLLQNTIYHPATEATRANPMPFHCPNSRSPVISSSAYQLRSHPAKPCVDG